LKSFRIQRASPHRPRHPATLADLADNEAATVSDIAVESGMRQRLLDLGLTKGTCIRCLGHSPAGDPAAYRIRGAVIALRNETASSIYIDRIH